MLLCEIVKTAVTLCDSDSQVQQTKSNIQCRQQLAVTLGLKHLWSYAKKQKWQSPQFGKNYRKKNTFFGGDLNSLAKNSKHLTAKTRTTLYK